VIEKLNFVSLYFWVALKMHYYGYKKIRKCQNTGIVRIFTYGLEKQIILATIEARKKAKLTQKELSEKSGIIQPSIAKIERQKRSSQVYTLLRLLYPLGYTLKVVPIDKKLKK